MLILPRQALSLAVALLGVAHAETGTSGISADQYLSFPQLTTTPPTDWDVKGTPQFSDGAIGLTSLSGGKQQSSLWSKYSNPFDEWTLEATVSVTGRPGPASGGGLAFWYAAKPNQEGPVYGSADNWDGLALVLDSYGWEASQKTPAEDSGVLRGHLNDGSVALDKLDHYSTNAFALCRINYRNTGAKFVVRVGYGESGLIVDVNGQKCFEQPNIVLPTEYFFGISASAPEESDSFVIHNFKVYPHLLPSSKSLLTGEKSQEHPQSPHEPHHPDVQEATTQPKATSQPQAAASVPSVGKEDLEALKNDILREVTLSNERLLTVLSSYSSLAADFKTLDDRILGLDRAFREVLNNYDKSLRDRYSSHQQELSGEINKIHDKLGKIDLSVHERTTTLQSSLSESLEMAIKNGGYSIWFVLVVAIAVLGAVFVGYNVYKTRKSYHLKYS